MKIYKVVQGLGLCGLLIGFLPVIAQEFGAGGDITVQELSAGEIASEEIAPVEIVCTRGSCWVRPKQMLQEKTIVLAEEPAVEEPAVEDVE